MTMLLDGEQTLRTIGERIRSRAWWTLVSAQWGQHAVSAVERAYYDGAASADFALLLLPVPGLPTISFAKKSRCSAAQLAATLHEAGDTRSDEATLLQRDVLLLTRGPDDRSLDGALALIAAAERATA